MRFTSTISSFKAGRLSPKLFGRIDTRQYQDGASKLDRMRPMPGGGLDRMWGTRFKYDANLLIGIADSKQFSFNIRDVSILCRLIRFNVGGFENRIDIQFLKYPYNSATDTSSVTMLPEGSTNIDIEQFDWAVLDDTLVITHYSGKMIPFYFKFNTTGDYSEMLVMGQGFPWGDVHPNVTEYNIANPGSPYTYNGVGLAGAPMSDVGEVGTTVTIGNPLSATGGRTFDVTSTDPDTVTILQRSLQLYLEGLGYKDFGDGNNRNVIASLSGYTTQTVTNGVRVFTPWNYTPGNQDAFTYASVTSTANWAYSLWYAGNWPRTVTNHEGRLVFGGTLDNPLTLFGSKVNAYRQFNQIRNQDTGSQFMPAIPPSGPVETTDPYVFTVSTKEDSRITFLQTAQALIVGSDKKEFVGSGGDTILSALSVNLKPYTSRGSKPCSAVTNGNAVYFVGPNGKALFRFKYNSSNGTFVATELSLLFSDLLEGDTISNISWVPHISALSIVMDSGSLYTIFEHQGEESETFSFCDPKVTGVTSACGVSVINPATGFAEVGSHLAILDLAASNGGVTLMFTETAESGLAKSYVQAGMSDINKHLYIDYATVLECTDNATGDWDTNGNVITSVTPDVVLIPYAIYSSVLGWTGNLYIIRVFNGNTNSYDHEVTTLTKATVDALPNSAFFTTFKEYTPSFTVNTGDVYLIGIDPPPAEADTMPIEAGQQWGTAQMGVKNIDTISVRYYKSYEYDVSSDGVNWQPITVADELGYPTTGRWETKFSSNPKYDHIVRIRSTKPEPLTILALSMRGLSNDG